jgi:hypothetical protein
VPGPAGDLGRGAIEMTYAPAEPDQLIAHRAVLLSYVMSPDGGTGIGSGVEVVGLDIQQFRLDGNRKLTKLHGGKAVLVEEDQIAPPVSRYRHDRHYSEPSPGRELRDLDG